MCIRDRYPGARLIGFGDGKNDLSLFEACDEAYAVSNACRELKERACGILENSRFDLSLIHIYVRGGL